MTKYIRQQYGKERATYNLTLSETNGQYNLIIDLSPSCGKPLQLRDKQLSGLVVKMQDEMGLPKKIHITNNDNLKAFYLMYKEAQRTNKSMRQKRSQ